MVLGILPIYGKHSVFVYIVAMQSLEARSCDDEYNCIASMNKNPGS